MPVIVVVIEAIADDESVGDREPAIIGLDPHFLTADFAEQDSGPDAQGPSLAHRADECREGVTGVEDIIKKEDVSARDVGRTTR